ncbi:MAG: anti-sigma regulatory factor [Nitrospiria bacterium]
MAINADVDIVTAREQGRALASRLGFSGSELTVIATAISEVARNIIEYGRRGEIVLSLIQQGNRRGIAIVARDEGPGIPNIAQAMQDGFTTGGGLGLGLPGARRLMDEFDIVSRSGMGTTVTMRKWKP